jgi:predicted dehydrogenase
MSDAINEAIPVRIGMLSFAHGHADSYAAALAKLPGVQLAGIYDDDPMRGQHAAEMYATTFYTEATTLLDQSLDGVIICSENVLHAPLVQLAASKTRNILCEKPIATTIADGQAMIDRCHKAGTKLQIAFPVRFAPSFQQLKQMLDRQEVGKVYSVKCTNHGSMPGGWFCNPILSGGGAVIDHTVHVIDLLRWFWHSEVVEVYAEIGTKLLHPDIDIDDAGLLSFRLANGIHGTLDTSWSRPPSYPTWGDVKIEVVGEKGVITVNGLNQHLSVSSERWGKTRWVGWGSDMDFGLIADFIETIRTGRAPLISGEDGLRALEVALAAYESAASHQPVTLAQMA